MLALPASSLPIPIVIASGTEVLVAAARAQMHDHSITLKLPHNRRSLTASHRHPLSPLELLPLHVQRERERDRETETESESEREIGVNIILENRSAKPRDLFSGARTLGCVCLRARHPVLNLIPGEQLVIHVCVHRVVSLRARKQSVRKLFRQAGRQVGTHACRQAGRHGQAVAC